ncbi:MAG: hypothetical protein OK452_09095 [Thaumarchaeota archaeon]|nr:hypothetical protein [Nitrososphaerota archaeon]
MQKKIAYAFRIGHTIFRKIDHPVLVYSHTISPGFDLHSESGRVTHIDNVRRGRALDGSLLLIAPNGAVVQHEQHGVLTLPEGIFTTSAVRDARPDELRARTLEFTESNQSVLNRNQLD